MPPKPTAKPRQKRIPLQETTANTGGNQATLAETWARAAEKKRMLELDATSTDHPNVKRGKNADVQEASDIPKREETAVELVPDKTIITISRKSGKAKSDIVQTLETRNHALHEFVIRRVLKQDINKRPTDHLSLVFNGYSSNYNISESYRRPEILQLRRKLDMLEVSPQARTHEVLLCFFSTDGFFTNVAGIYEFFRIYVNVPITMMVFKGGREFSLHPIKDVLAAIANARAARIDPSNRHQILVFQMIGVSMTKESIATAIRDLRYQLPERRNTMPIDLDDSDYTHNTADKTEDKTDKPTVVVRPDKTPSVLRYAVHQGPNGGFICPVETCKTILLSIEMLPQHVFDHNKRAKECVLCEEQPEGFVWPGTKNWLDHIGRHLPSMWFCREADCIKYFFTKGDLTQHGSSHDKSHVVACEKCGSEIHNTFMKQHLNDFCPVRNRDEDIHKECHYCSKTFKDYTSLYKHVSIAHKRRDEILSVADDAGLFAAGTPGLGLSAPAIIEDAFSKALAKCLDSTEQQTEQVEVFAQTKMNGTKIGDALRSLRGS